MPQRFFSNFDFTFQECEEPIIIVDHRFHILFANELAKEHLQVEEDIDIKNWLSEDSYDVWKKIVENTKTRSYTTEKMSINTLNSKIEDMKVTSCYSDVYDWILLCFHYSEVTSKVDKHLAVEKKFRRVFDQSESGLLLTDADKRIVEMNEMAAKLLNVSLHSIIGQDISILWKLFPNEGYNIHKFFCSLKETGKGELTVQVPMKEGTRYIQLLSNYDSQDDIHLTIIRDETERIMMMKRLEHQQTLQMVGEMAASIAHEIKNPMTTLKGFTDLMKMTATGENKRYLSVLDREIERIENIVNEFLDLSKPGGYEMNIFSFSELMEETIELMQPQSIMQHVEIEYEKNLYQEDLILGNSHKLKQVLINLLKNAFEVMPSGGKIVIRQQIKYYDKVTISIEDSGTGMSENDLENIFTPFYTTKSEGTGLGLAFVAKTVEEHNGKITATSKVGEGTIFSIDFPLVIQKQREMVAEKSLEIDFADLTEQSDCFYSV